MISILLATSNGEKYLKESIESIIDQTFNDFEILVGLNGTKDGTIEVVNQFNDPRIRVLDYGADRGKAKTLNKLIKESRNKLICLQDDDDIWIPNKLETQVRYIDLYDVVGTFINYIDSNGRIVGYPNLQKDDFLIKKLSMAGENQIANTSAIFKKSDAIYLGGWREDIDGIEDYDFWLRLMRIGKKFINIPEYLVLHRIHNQSNFNTKRHDISKIL